MREDAELSRSILSNLDRKLLSNLSREEQFRMVRVPVSDATWSIWQRYCKTAGVAMGRAIALLIEAELSEATGSSDLSKPGISEEVERALAAREEAVAAREEVAAAEEQRLAKWSVDLREQHASLRARQRLTDWSTPKPAQRQVPAAGRNQLCPCGSGIKYKRCHGA